MKLSEFVPVDGGLVLKLPDYGPALPKKYDDPRQRLRLRCVKGKLLGTRYNLGVPHDDTDTDLAGKDVLVYIGATEVSDAFTLEDVGGLFIIYPGYQILGTFITEQKS